MPLLEVVTDADLEPGDVVLCGSDGKPLPKGSPASEVHGLRMHPDTARALEASGRVCTCWTVTRFGGWPWQVQHVDDPKCPMHRTREEDDG